jgi:integrase/recombinase XerD
MDNRAGGDSIMPKAYLEPREVRELEEATEYLRDKLLIRLLFRLGCRVSEALGITLDDIDFAQGMVTIQHLKVRLKLSCPDCSTRLSKTAKFCPGCGQRIEKTIAEEKERRRVRTLPIDGGTLEMVKDYIDRGGPVSSDGKQLLFGINRHRAWQIVKECAEKAGLGRLVNPETGKVHHISPHKLRDSFAIMAVKKDDSGDGLRLLQEHLGHQSFNTTAKYRKISGKEHKEWYEKLWS